jgi:hypothetical protein
MTFKVTKKDLNESIRDIRKALRVIEERINTPSLKLEATDYNSRLDTLLCRVGSLKVSLNYLQDSWRNPKAEIKDNPLCNCYDKDQEKDNPITLNDEETIILNEFIDNYYSDYSKGLIRKTIMMKRINEKLRAKIKEIKAGENIE